MIHTLGDKNTCHTIVHDIIILDQNDLKRNEGMTATTLLTPCCSLSRKAKWSRLRTKTTPHTTSPLSNTTQIIGVVFQLASTSQRLLIFFTETAAQMDIYDARLSSQSDASSKVTKEKKKANEEADNSQTFAAVSIKRKPALTCDTLNKT